jgi:polyisoprenoid-binding protein YceI
MWARDLTIRGTTKIGASASGKINRQDFGVKYHEVMDNGGLGVADVFIQNDVDLIQRAPRTSSN